MANNNPSALDLEDVHFAWKTGGNEGFRIELSRFQLNRAESFFLHGPSGSGKSTLLGLICGTLVPQRGHIKVLDQDLTQLSGNERDRFRADHIGVIFQMFNLVPYLSALDNVLLALEFAPKRRTRAGASVAERTDEALRLMSALGLAQTEISHQKAMELSIGQQQRVAAARALIGRPELIVADEPTSALDANRQVDFLDLLFGEVKSSGSTLVMVSHDERMRSKFSQSRELAELIS